MTHLKETIQSPEAKPTKRRHINSRIQNSKLPSEGCPVDGKKVQTQNKSRKTVHEQNENISRGRGSIEESPADILELKDKNNWIDFPGGTQQQI